jgi:hypothetical protein
MEFIIKKEGINCLYIYYRIPLDFYMITIPHVKCSNSDEVRHIIVNNRGYRIILVCRTEHTQELKDIISSRCIYEIYVLGDEIGLNVNNKKVTLVKTNEKDLMLDIMCSVIDYTHDEQIQQQNSCNDNVADERISDVSQILNQIETLYFNGL